MTLERLEGLIAAVHTPFAADGSLNVGTIEKQAEHLIRTGVRGVFLGGTTGECHSLTVDERMALAQRWLEVARGTSLAAIVHVGGNCLEDGRALALHAEKHGATAVAALAPSYFKPQSVEVLGECCAHLASACPRTPFFFYDIPSLTGVNLPMPELLRLAGRIPNFAGLKFTNVDLATFGVCLAAEHGRYQAFWGVDEMLLGALAFGAVGAVGSTYNMAAPLYNRMIEAFHGGELATARDEQLRSIELVRILSKRGYMASAKAMMGMLGADVGPARLPHRRLTEPEIRELGEELAAAGHLA
ncbi:MAG TPA: dihydrodipicolinate synthase family protein [Planctomycetia bacterium]|nr:dihydrodipicolinate synthase family protein [Planctomycetia bacterium]